MASNERRAAEVIMECPWEVESMTLTELLSSQRRWGRTRTRKFLAPLALTENKRIGTLTHRQRQLLASALAVKTGSALPETDEHPAVPDAFVAA